MKSLLGLFTRKQSTVRSAAMVLMVMVFVSRVLGLVRDRFLAARFSPDELGVYLAAFRMPNFLFELLVMGALTSAFIPVYTKYIAKDKQDEAWHISSTLINFSVIALIIISIPILIWTKQIAGLIAPGFNPAEIDRMVQFTRFMVVLQVIPLLVGNFFTGILQSHHMFFLPALAPVVYNFGIIIGIVLFSTSFGLWGPVIGVGIGALLFMLIQIPPLIKLGYRQKLELDLKHEGVREVGKLMLPRTAGLAVSQVDSTVDLILSTLLGARMVTVFNFAQQLQQLPIGLFGATVAQAAFPLLSQASASEDKEQYLKTLSSAVNQIMFFIMPMSALFIVLRIPIVRLVFGASRFDWQATVLTGMTLSAFSVSLGAQAASQLFTRGFYALFDTMTPMVIGVITIALNTILSIIFIQVVHLPVWALGMSTTIASFFNAGLLLIFLERRMKTRIIKTVLTTPVKIFIASLLTGVALYVPLKLFDQLIFDTTRTFGLLLLTGVSGISGVAVYLFLVWTFGVTEAKSFLALLAKFRQPKQIIIEPANEVVENGSQNTPLT